MMNQRFELRFRAYTERAPLALPEASTIWACSGQEDDPERPGYLRLQDGRKIADEHYERSVWEDTRRGGDELVMELLRRSESKETPGGPGRAKPAVAVNEQKLVGGVLK